MRRIAPQRRDDRRRGRVAALFAGALRPRGRSPRQHAALLHDRRGVSALVFALSALVIIGFVGFATEAGVWYEVRRTAQGAADAAAIAGALAANPTNNSGTNP